MFRKIGLTFIVALWALASSVAFAQQITGITPPAAATGTMSLAPGPVIGATGIGTPVVVQAAPDYTFKTGDFVATIINWVEVAFGGTIASLVTAGLFRGLALIGVQTTQQQRDKLQSIVANGLNKAAAQAQVAAQGNTAWNVQIKNKVVADTVKYVQDHASDTIKALGLDPQSGAAVDAIKARIETAIVDDNTPTNPAVNPGITASTTSGLQLSPLTKTTT